MCVVSLVSSICTALLHWWFEFSLALAKFVTHQRKFVDFIFAKRFPKCSFEKKGKCFYVGLLELGSDLFIC